MSFHIESFRLFYGDTRPINITSIRIIEKCLNLESQIGVITSLDWIISNNLRYSNRISADSIVGAIIQELFDYIVDSKSSMRKQQFDSYLYQTFNCFIDHKESIYLHMENIHNHVKDKKLLELLFYHIDKEEDGIGSWYKEGMKQNLLKPCVLQVLRNVKYIWIYAHDYPFSLLEFLSTIQHTSVHKVEILVENILEAISNDFDELKSKYAAKGFDVKIDDDEYGDFEICITKKD